MRQSYCKWHHSAIRLFMTMIVLVLTLGFLPAKTQAASLSKTKLYLGKGDTCQLKVKGAYNSVSWKSSKPKIVKVSSSGLVKVKKTGTAIITAKTGGETLNCNVIAETVSVNRARRLRNHILKKGEYDSSTGLYTISGDGFDDTELVSYYWKISASKKNNKLTFEYKESPDSPSSNYIVRMSINLISGKSSVKTGSVTYLYRDAYSESDDYEADGKITTQYTSAGKNLTLTKVILQDTDEIGDLVDVIKTDEETLTRYRSTVSIYLNKGFDRWNELLAKQSSLKKYKISMKVLGFKKKK